MNFTSKIAKNFMFTRKEAGPTRITGLIAILGIAVGTMAMVLSVSVLNGFESRIVDRVIGFEGDIKLRGNFKYDDNLEPLTNISGVDQIVPYVDRVGLMIANDKSTRMITFKSIDLNKIENFYDINIDVINSHDHPKIIIGKTTARRMNLRVGDEVKIMSPLDQNTILGLPRQFRVIVGGIFNVQVLDFNDKIAFIEKDVGKRLFLRKNEYDGIDIRIKKESSLSKIKSEIYTLFPDSDLQTWKDLHSNLFSAMKLERIGSLIVLSLIVLVGCFNLSTTLMLITIQKIKQYGILSTLGATKNMIRNIIIKQGVFTGTIGISIGITLGLVFVIIQSIFGLIKLPGDIYFTSYLPMVFYFYDFLLILLISFTMVLFSSMVAAKRTNLATLKNSLTLEK
tara:strand:- start:26047 stop:27234 length:1188 start_codon:yes stop_codon:yes gene_type:complete